MPADDGNESAPGEGMLVGGAEDLPPTDADELLTWLRDGRYLSWAGESAVHPGAGPHFGSVRTYVSDELLQSLEKGDPAHPIGAAAVKELYGAGDSVSGWAVMRKLESDSESGQGWFWYEYYEDSVLASGAGVGLCTGCHGGGEDYVLTPFPLQ